MRSRIETVWAEVLIDGNMDKLEVDEKNGGYPTVDGGIRLNFGVGKYAANVPCVHLRLVVPTICIRKTQRVRNKP